MTSPSTLQMETLSGAIRRLERAGFSGSFRARPDGLLALEANRLYAPEDLVVEEIVRFEGDSDPEEQAVLFALSSRDGRARGTFIATYGVFADPTAAEIMRRLEAPATRRRRVQ
jgi:hypothetical protein